MKVLFLFVLLVGKSLGGARDSALGGALYADYKDIYAILYNPAALIYFKGKPPELLISYNGVNRDLTSYQQASAFATPVNKELGLAALYSVDIFPQERIGNGEYIVTKENSYRILLGIPTKGRLKNIGVGISLNYKEIDFKHRKLTIERGAEDKYLRGGKLSDIHLGILYRLNENLTFGFTIEDLTESSIDLGYEMIGTKSYHLKLAPAAKFNLGVAVENKKNRLYAGVYAFSLKNLYDKDGEPQSSIRLGIEYFLSPNLILRAGVYGKDFLALGIGFQDINLSEFLQKNLKLTLNYAWLDWGFFSNHIVDFKFSF